MKKVIKPNNSFRSGFIAVIGKPNTGKSTLINSIVGSKVAITSPKPQTTRHRILGVKNKKNCQMVFVDTPGVHKPTHELGRFMEKTYKNEVLEADLVFFVSDASVKMSEEDIRAKDVINSSVRENVPVFLVINKADLVKDDELLKIKAEFELSLIHI